MRKLALHLILTILHQLSLFFSVTFLHKHYKMRTIVLNEINVNHTLNILIQYNSLRTIKINYPHLSQATLVNYILKLLQEK